MQNGNTIKPTILIVEDDMFFAQYCLLLLQNMGYHCVVCHTGKEALKVLDTHANFSLIILDIELPDISGYAVAEEINKKKKSPIPFVFLTTLSNIDNVTKGYELGAIDYISKPINDIIFKAKLKHILSFVFQKDVNDSLKKEVRDLSILLENSLEYNSTGVIEIHPKDLKICFANPAASKILGVNYSKLHNININEILPEANGEHFSWQQLQIECKKKPTNKKHYESSFWYQTGYGKDQLIKLKITPTNSQNNTYYLHISDISPIDKLEKAYFSSQNLDELTGLANHRYFTQKCEEILSKNINGDKKMAMILIDIEHFSNINERYGHDIGDQLLMRVAARLKANIRPFDMLARLGNDEFAILCNGIPQWGLEHCIVELIDSFTKPLTLDESISISIKCNVGVAHTPACGNSFTIIYQCAKIALDKARKDPIKSSYFYDDKQDQESRKFQKIVSMFDKAIANNEFSIAYQPQFKLSNNKIIGVEALIRWETESEGMIPPSLFIPIAEQSYHIVEIGQWLISKVASDVASIKKFKKNKLRLAINLSAVQLVESNLLILIHQLYQSIVDNDLSPSNFDLEITEHAFMEFNDKVINYLKDLQTKDFNISLDDFGTGYSSLSYIQKIPLNNIKIDISFIRLIGEDKSVEEIIKLIINLAKVLGLKTIAEGIETQTQLDFLKENKCDYGQGYFFSRPVSITKLKALINK